MKYNGKMTRIHRVIYEKMYGNIPDNLVINHINGKKDENRIDNLELLTNQQNCQYKGKYSNNTSSQKNIHWHKASGKWWVSIIVNGKKKYYGSFERIEDAIIKRDQVILQLNNQGNNYITEFPI
jgi:hypothetical protein